MGFVNSALGQITGVIPDSAEPPNVHTHLLNIMNQMERRGVMRFSSTSVRDSTVTSPENGMVCAIGSPASELFVYLSNSWQKLYPRMYSGTTTPSNSLGANGDLYIQHS